MADFDYDFLIIGGGSAGATAAVAAINFNVPRVAVVEKGLLGGTCTNVGCVPSKSFLHAAELARNIKQTRAYNLISDSQPLNFGPIKRHKDNIVGAMRDAGTKAIERAGIQVINGSASFEGADSIAIDGQIIKAKHILLATGAAPAVPQIEGLGEVPYLTSTDALNEDKLPQSIIIVGGAYIGLEFASFFQALGVKTTVIEALPRLAPTEDEMVSAELEKALVKQDIEIAVKTKVSRVSEGGEGVNVFAEKDGSSLTFTGERILIATGRTPNLGSLNLEAAGVKYGRKGVEADEYLKTSAPSIYAAGDLLPPPSLQLEHVAVYEGWLAANNIFSQPKKTADYRVIPRVMFSFPEVASVGETAEQAKAHANAVSITYPYAGIAMAQISEETGGLIRLVADADTGELLGAHIIGTEAGNLIHLAALAMRFHLPVTEIAGSVSAYPAMAQGFYYACEMLADKLRGL